MKDRPLGDPDDQIIEFSYSPNGWNSTYAQEDTLLPVGNAAGNLASIYLAYPNAHFDIIGHSLGGVVALHALQNFPSLRQRTGAVITVDSPVRGAPDISRWFHANSGTYCGDPSQTLFRTVRYPVYADLDPGSPVIQSIVNGSWDDVRLATVTNSADTVVLPSTATLDGPSVFCMPVDWNYRIDPSLAHSIILIEYPIWFSNLVKVAYNGRLKTSAC